MPAVDERGRRVKPKPTPRPVAPVAPKPRPLTPRRPATIGGTTTPVPYRPPTTKPAARRPAPKPAARRPAATPGASLAERVKNDPGLLRRALKNPGLRSKLPERYLSPQQRRARQMNVRLNAPIVQGSTTTERDLAREAQAAGDVQFGDVERQQQRVLGEERTRQRDMGSFYDEYLRELDAHRQQTQQIGAQAGQQLQGMQAGITGLAAADLTGLQNPAVTDAQARGAQAGDLSQMASNAAAVRQGLVGSFIARHAGESAAEQASASQLANVIGPGQKLWAAKRGQGRIRQAEEDITGTAAKRGAADVQFRAERRGEEAKNVLARQTLAGNVAEDQTQAALDAARLAEDKRSNLADEANASKSRTATQQAAADTPYTSGAFAGKTKGEVLAMSPKDRQKIVDKYNARGGSSGKTLAPAKQYADDFFRKYGVKPASTEGVNKAKSDIQQVKLWLNRLGGDLGAAGRTLTTGQEGFTTEEKNEKTGKKEKVKSPTVPKFDPVLVRAAMDIRQHGAISASTAHRLHKAGYSVQQLGLSTKAPAKKPAVKKPAFNPSGSNLGKLPGAR